MAHEGPIGVFDSGVGGLSVLRHIRAALPREHLLYVADSGHAPYGEKSAAWILQRSEQLARFLLDHGAKALVIACNTATAAAAAALRAQLAVPVVAMEPAVKPAVAGTRSGVVGVLATTGTLKSARFAALLDNYAGDVRVLTEPCPGWVDAVERGAVDGDETRQLVRRHVQPLLDAGADVLVLGCTHYPFLRPLIEAIAGAGVQVIDTGAAVAKQLQRRLDDAGLLNGGPSAGTERFWSSGDPAHARDTLAQLWPGAGQCARLPDLDPARQTRAADHDTP